MKEIQIVSKPLRNEDKELVLLTIKYTEDTHGRTIHECSGLKSMVIMSRFDRDVVDNIEHLVKTEKFKDKPLYESIKEYIKERITEHYAYKGMFPDSDILLKEIKHEEEKPEDEDEDGRTDSEVLRSIEKSLLKLIELITNGKGENANE